MARTLVHAYSLSFYWEFQSLWLPEGAKILAADFSDNAMINLWVSCDQSKPRVEIGFYSVFAFTGEVPSEDLTFLTKFSHNGVVKFMFFKSDGSITVTPGV